MDWPFFRMELDDIECHELNSINTRFFPENAQTKQISDLNGKAEYFFYYSDILHMVELLF